MSGHFGTSADMSTGNSALVPKCLGSELSRLRIVCTSYPKSNATGYKYKLSYLITRFTIIHENICSLPL